MRKQLPVAVLGIAVAAAATLSGATGAGAALPYSFVGYSGGSLVRAANNTVTSDLTAASYVNAQAIGTDTNKVAGANVANLLRTGAVSTSTSSKVISGGYEVVSEAETDGLSALNGAITAKAIDTTSTVQLVHGKTSYNSVTTFVGIHIAGAKLPVKIPQNFHVTIPNVASVYLNYSIGGGQGESIMGIGAGLFVTLLKAQGSNAVGAAALLSPTYAAIGPVSPPDTSHAVSGKAYGTRVTANAGSLVGVQSDPTAPISLATAGTGGKTKTSNTAGATLSRTLHVGAVVDTVSGTNTNSRYEAETTSRVAGLNLLDGLIRADAVSVDAHVAGRPGAATTVTGASSLAGLTVGGRIIPVTTKPNTVLHLLNVGTVTINQQSAGSNSITVRALDIRITTASYGLPAGAEIQVATATAAAA